MGSWELARQHPWVTRLCQWLILFAWAATRVSTSAAQADFTAPNCESRYEGISYCVEDNGDIHIVIIDLDNPYIRFEMVMADDVTSVDTTRRERIEDMVRRPPYIDQEVVVAINADYFGHQHGPEGLTVKDGRRLDDQGGRRQNPNALWRSSLAISRLNRVSLGRKSAEELEDPRAYRESFFQAIGGGPLILSHSVVIPNAIACLLERFPIGACRRTIQTAVGLSEDGRWLYLAAGQGRDIEGFGRLLREYGAFTGIKLDGGGSSQLWYDGQMRHDTDRAVGNALLVSYGPVPRHDARFDEPFSVHIAEPGEHIAIDFEIHNTGFLDWEPDLGYRFQNVQGWPVLGPAFQRLPTSVPSGTSLLSSIDIVAPHVPGVYEAQWQLARRSEPIGSRLGVSVVVAPTGSETTGLTDRIQSRLAGRSNQPGFEREWPDLRQEIEEEIERQVIAELRATLDEESGWGIFAMQGKILDWWLPLLERLPR